jgi:hypothetical protein
MQLIVILTFKEMHKIIEIYQKDEAPHFVEKCYQRVTQEMINCQVRIISRNILKDVNGEYQFTNFLGNMYEKEAKYYYESTGFTVIRLEHFASNAVGEKESIFPEAKVLGDLLRKHLSKDDYNKYIFKKSAVKNVLVLNGIDPKDYSISFYPPDFLVINNNDGKWKFVEVKGPTDKLHFRQANWFVNLIPESWDYEIIALLNKKFDETYLCKIPGSRSGDKFNKEYAKKQKSVKGYNQTFKKSVGAWIKDLW